MNYHDHKSTIEACLNCAAICNHCASSCLNEENVNAMARCIRLDLECAAVCYTAAQLMSLGSSKAREMCLLCANICKKCAEECEKHQHEHCQKCARACMDCAEYCALA